MKINKMEWMKPLSDKCRGCEKKVTDHHWFCNDCWTLNQKRKMTLKESIIFRKRMKNKLIRIKKNLKKMEIDYEEIKNWNLVEVNT